MSKLHLEIVTPERSVFGDDVDMVVVPAVEGDIGILPSHIPLFTKIRVGEIMIKKDNKEFFLAVAGGFVEIIDNNVNILANYAVRAEEVEIAKAEEAKKRAAKIMEERITQEEFAIAQTEFLKAVLELKIANKRKLRA